MDKHINFISFEDFKNKHNFPPNCCEGTFTFSFNKTIGTKIYYINNQFKLYWEIFNTLTCITLPKEIELFSIDKIKDIKLEELKELQNKIINKHTLTQEENNMWIVDIITLFTLGYKNVSVNFRFKPTDKIITEEEGSRADINDLVDYIEGRTNKKPT